MDNTENSISSVKVDTDSFPLGEGWTPELEIYLNNISVKCITFRNIHEKSATYYSSCFNYFSLFLIFVSFLASIITVIPIDHQAYNYITSIFTIFTSALATTNKFLKWQDIGTSHRNGSQKFLELNENITSQVLTDTEKRIHGIQYIRWAGKTFNDIRKSLPFPPDKIVSRLNADDDPNITLEEIYNNKHYSKKEHTIIPTSLKKLFSRDKNDIQEFQLESINSQVQVQEFDQQYKNFQELELRKLKCNVHKFQT
jgi:hypothetical protein